MTVTGCFIPRGDATGRLWPTDPAAREPASPGLSPGFEVRTARLDDLVGGIPFAMGKMDTFQLGERRSLN